MHELTRKILLFSPRFNLLAGLALVTLVHTFSAVPVLAAESQGQAVVERVLRFEIEEVLAAVDLAVEGLSVEHPPDVEGGLQQANLNTVQRATDIFAWQDFIALNWPALDGEGAPWVMLAGGVGSAPFLMAIEGVHSIEGRGTVATGRIEQGRVRPGDKVEIVGLKEKLTTVCTSVA